MIWLEIKGQKNVHSRENDVFLMDYLDKPSAILSRLYFIML